MKTKISSLLIPLILLFACANQTTPEGGPRDLTPPKLVRSNPQQNETNFKQSSIELTFSEDVILNNPKEEIMMIPAPGKKTEYKVKNNKVTIIPENDWKENTTYTINFREGIKDLTEGNAAADLQLAFSTGPDIDSLKIMGSIREALKETIPEKITVAIYASDTFDIFKHSPEYFTKSTKEGTFELSHLKPGTYRLYAFDDKNKNLKLESRTERFGFLADSIKLDSIARDNVISLVNLDTRPIRLTSVRTQSNVNTIRLNKAVKDYKIKSDTFILNTYGTTQGEVIAYFPNLSKDSLQISFQATDSLDQKIDTLIFIKKDSNQKIKETFKTNSSESILNIETDEFNWSVTFNKPLAFFNPDSMYIVMDSTHTIPIKNQKVQYDTMKNKVTVQHKIIIPDSVFNPSPKLKLATGLLVSIDGDSSKMLAIPLKLMNSETTAILHVEIETDQPYFITQIINSKGNIEQSSRNQKKTTFKYLPAESFKIRLIIDRNNNGIWDSANPITQTEPEKIIYYVTPDKKYETPLRANWEVGPLTIKYESIVDK